jgi:GNAT superfamily N-acetyltransferase
MKKIYMYWIDTYFLFRINLNENKIDEKIDLNGEYSIVPIDSINDEHADSLSLLWCRAYEVTPEAGCRAVRDLFQRGDICLGLIYRNNVVGMTWYGQEMAIDRIDFAHILKKESRVGLAHHAFIVEDHRGKGLQRALYSEMFLNGRKRGCHFYYGFVGVKNFASVRNTMKSFAEYKVVFHVKIDVPFFTFNLFPGYRQEKWVAC